MAISRQQTHGIRMYALALVAMLVAIGLPQTAHAQKIEQADSKLIGSTTGPLLRELPLPGGELPGYLATLRDVYLLVDAGGSYEDIHLLAQPTVSGPILARALASATRGTQLSNSTVQWSIEDYAVAEIDEKHPHPLALSSSTDVSIAAMVNSLTAAGYRVHSLIHTRPYSKLTPSIPSIYTTHYHWYAGPELLKSPTFRVTTTAPVAQIALVLAIVLIPVLISFLCLFFATRRAKKVLKRADVNIKQERLRFTQTAVMAPLVSYFPGVFLSIFLLANSGGRAISDVWTGDSSSGIIFIMLPAFFISTIPFTALASRRSITLFGRPDAAIHEAMTPEERKLTSRARSANLAPHMIAMALLFTGSTFIKGPIGRSMHAFIMPVSMFLGIGIGALYTRRIKALTQSDIDDSLTWRAQQLAMHFGRRVHAVRIDRSGRGKTRPFCEITAAEMVVSEFMLGTFTPAELEFALANQIATTAPKLSRGFYWIMIVPLLFLTILIPTMRLAMNWAGPWFPLLVLAPAFLMLPVMLFLGPRRRKGMLEERHRSAIAGDTAAVEVTKDFAAALSVLRKQSESTLADVMPTPTRGIMSPAEQWQARIVNMEQLAESRSKILL